MKFSLGAKKTNNVKLATDRKRPRALLDDDDEEPETAQPIAITGFADGGVIQKDPVKEDKAPIIRGIPNRDWREESKRKRQQSRIPGAERNAQISEAEIKEKEAKVMQFGLTVVEKSTKTDDEGDVVMEEEQVEKTEVIAAPKPPQTEINDETALQALIHGTPVDDGQVIIAATEEEAFERDIQTAPDAPTLDDYEAMPVESFALAYLRGYGWKEGQDLGKDKKPAKTSKSSAPPARRPALLGIGAKEEAAVGVELGTWGKASKGKRKVDEVYNPLVLVNKQTGEKLSEEELGRKLEAQKLVVQQEDGRRRKRSRSPRDERAEKEGRKIRYDDDDYERRRGKESDRDRDRRRDRDRDRDYGRDRDRDRDRDRRRDYDGKHTSSHRDKDRRERSPSSDDRKRKRRDYDDDRDSEGSKRRYKDDRERDRGSSKREGRDRERDRERERDYKYSSSSRR